MIMSRLSDPSIYTFQTLRCHLLSAYTGLFRLGSFARVSAFDIATR